jgi:hypothetical protein
LFTLRTMKKGVSKTYNTIVPKPAAPSQLCQYLLETLTYDNATYDDKAGEVLCGPVLVRLLVGSDTIQTIELGKERPLNHLNDIDRDRVQKQVTYLIDIDRKLKDRDAVQRMLSLMNGHMLNSEDKSLVISHPCFNSPGSVTLDASGSVENPSRSLRGGLGGKGCGKWVDDNKNSKKVS